MSKPANNLSEAFLKVREYLWDGSCAFATVYPKQEFCICLAATLARRAGVITLDQHDKIHQVVQKRIYPHLFVSQYVRAMYKEDQPSARSIQEYRHDWLIELSKEFADETANP